MLNRLLFAGAVLVGLVAAPQSATFAQQTTLYPLGLVQAKDATYIVDLKLRGVWKSTGGKLSVFAQAPKTLGAPLYAPRCIALDKNGEVLVGDSATREVYRIDASGKLTALTNKGIGIPMSIAVATDGTLFVADLELHRIYTVPHEGGKPTVFCEVLAPRGVAFDSKGNLIVVSSRENQVYQVDSAGKKKVIVKGSPFDLPHNVTVGPDDTLYITDGLRGHGLWKATLDGKTEKLVDGKPLINPIGVSMHGDHLLIVDSRANAVFRYDLTSKSIEQQIIGE